ncbi:MAG: SDR family NAD(P)-dependent oxidoreductase [Paracoccaceae bacterium]|nr:SDR family NAD(P)-dependent oxidoreductase [Paracoccaceae bacterium]
MKNEFITAIVTGGASGIGASVVREIIHQGGTVGVIDLNIEKGESLTEELGVNCIFERADVTDESGFSTAYEALKEKLPSITGCVTCAGVLPVRHPISDHSLADFRRIMDNHLAGTFLTCKIVGSEMAERNFGSIVTLGSALAVRPGPPLGYSAGKAGVVNLSQSLAVQWGKKNVRVNSVCPGWVDTPFIRQQEKDGRDLSPITEVTPIGRLIKPEEIAKLVLFLLSAASSAVTGAVVVADGGITLAGGYLPYGALP